MSEPSKKSFVKLSKPWARWIGTLSVVGAVVAGSLASLDAEARRMGGGGR